MEELAPLGRYLALVRGRLPDRVPVSPFIMSLAARYIGVDYGDYCRHGEVMARAQIECVRRFGYDSVNVTADAVREAETVGLRVAWPENDVPAAAGEPLIWSTDDLRRLVLPDPLGANRMHEQIKAVTLMRRALEAEGQLCWGWVEAPFEESAILRNLNYFMVDLVERPELAHQILRFSLELAIEFGLAQIEAGTPFLGIGDPICTLASAKHFEKFNLPYLTRLIAAFKRRGAVLLYHVCGNARHLLPLLAQLDVDVIQLDSKIDLAEARRILPERIAIMGNLDPTQVMLNGAPPEVLAAGRECIRKAGRAGQFILSAGCEVPRDTPYENLDALVQCAVEFGRYPLADAE